MFTHPGSSGFISVVQSPNELMQPSAIALSYELDSDNDVSTTKLQQLPGVASPFPSSSSRKSRMATRNYFVKHFIAKKLLKTNFLLHNNFR